MRLLKTTITPTSNFVTTLKGDTLFGQLCWAIVHEFGKDRLEELLKEYETAPFLVVSDGFPVGFLPKPKLPSAFINDGADKKISRKKVWMSVEGLIAGDFKNAKTDEEIGKDKRFTVMHNSINYKTFTTDEGTFAPYGSSEISFLPKDIYCLLDETKLQKDELKKVFDFMATHGYGKDTTIGKGRFECGEFENVDFLHTSNTVIAMSPFSAQNLACKKLYCEPFTRFGKKGGDRANKNPFKKPLLLADTASVVIFETPQKIGYIGSAITKFSSHDDIVHQGYAIALPIKEIQDAAV